MSTVITSTAFSVLENTTVFVENVITNDVLNKNQNDAYFDIRTLCTNLCKLRNEKLVAHIGC